ncbi:transposase [Azospirillum sp. YIM B02556]|uniref:Transposase n=1 Tax=Azospirillum endophyticum TaxID=2800326 RepID=A0ABS1FHA6_9PROT|nr:transposase [Azospirillum endophyticum]
MPAALTSDSPMCMSGRAFLIAVIFQTDAEQRATVPSSHIVSPELSIADQIGLAAVTDRAAGSSIRWGVERPFAWLSRSWHLARDYERLPETGTTMVHMAKSPIMPRHVARS